MKDNDLNEDYYSFESYYRNCFDKNGNPEELDFSKEGKAMKFKKLYFENDEEKKEEIIIDFQDEEFKDIDELENDNLEDEDSEEEDNDTFKNFEDQEVQDFFDWITLGDNILMEEKEFINEVAKKKERTRIDRLLVRARKEALNKATKGQWNDWGIDQRANFIAKWEFKKLGPTRGRYIKRKKPIPTGEARKRLKKQAKLFKRLLKTRGAAIRKKALRKRGR